jgi:hypothetical protein
VLCLVIIFSFFAFCHCLVFVFAKLLPLVIIFPFFALCHCLVFVFARECNISGASTFLPCCSDKIRFKRVVFPLPKNPVSIVTGMRGSKGFSEDAAGDLTDRDDTLRNPILRSPFCLILSKFERLILKDKGRGAEDRLS